MKDTKNYIISQFKNHRSTMFQIGNLIYPTWTDKGIGLLVKKEPNCWGQDIIYIKWLTVSYSITAKNITNHLPPYNGLISSEEKGK